MLRDTFDRLEPLAGAERTLVLTSSALAVAVREEWGQNLSGINIILNLEMLLRSYL